MVKNELIVLQNYETCSKLRLKIFQNLPKQLGMCQSISGSGPHFKVSEKRKLLANDIKNIFSVIPKCNNFAQLSQNSHCKFNTPPFDLLLPIIKVWLLFIGTKGHILICLKLCFLPNNNPPRETKMAEVYPRRRSSQIQIHPRFKIIRDGPFEYQPTRHQQDSSSSPIGNVLSSLPK